MRITEHIHMLHMPFTIPVAPEITIERSVNIFLIEGNGGFCLVDAGVAGNEKAVFSYIKGLGYTPADIGTLILTHAHPDHVGAAEAVRRETGCVVAAHGGDRAWIEDTELQVRERPVPGFHTLVAGSVKVDRVLVDGDMLDIGGLVVKVIHTPGHSRGSISLHMPADRAIIAGDAVPVPGEPPIYDAADASRKSVERIMAVQGADVLLSSWDDPRRGDDAVRVLGESLRWMERARDAVRNVLEGGCGTDAPDFTVRVLAVLGIPPKAANPLTVRTFIAEAAALST